MAGNVVFSISTEMEMEGRQLKSVKPNKDGVYTGIPLTVIGCNSRNNVNYEKESVLKCITDQQSRFCANVKTGDMEGEWGHPLLTGGNCLERLLHIERTRVSHFFTRVYGKEENGLIIIYGDVKPFGPFKQCLIDSFEDPTRNTSFSLRSAAKPIGQSADGIVQKRMLALVTFAAVDGPGFLMASNRFRDPDVATESLHPHVSDNIIQVDFSVNKKQFLDSVEYRKAAGFESFEVLDQRVLDAFGCDKVTIKETTTLTAVGHNQFVNEAGKNVSLFDACFGS